MTEAEHVLWRELRGKRLGVKFRRQEPISDSIVDFYAPSILLAVEVDGDIHETRKLDDFIGDSKLAAVGVLVLRFKNDEVVDDLHSVLDRIHDAIEHRLASPPFPLRSANTKHDEHRRNEGRTGARGPGG